MEPSRGILVSVGVAVSIAASVAGYAFRDRVETEGRLAVLQRSILELERDVERIDRRLSEITREIARHRERSAQ